LFVIELTDAYDLLTEGHGVAYSVGNGAEGDDRSLRDWDEWAVGVPIERCGRCAVIRGVVDGALGNAQATVIGWAQKEAHLRPHHGRILGDEISGRETEVDRGEEVLLLQIGK